MSVVKIAVGCVNYSFAGGVITITGSIFMDWLMQIHAI
jgi:hypothetical protein